MIRKYRSPLPGHVRVVFELPSCVWADRIFLTGDFNDWQQDDIRLQQDRTGVWQTTLDLPCGRQYEFRYLIDGQWRTDSHADGFADNQFGSENSVVDTNLPATEQVVPDTALVHDSRPKRPFDPIISPQRAVPSIRYTVIHNSANHTGNRSANHPANHAAA